MLDQCKVSPVQVHLLSLLAMVKSNLLAVVDQSRMLESKFSF